MGIWFIHWFFERGGVMRLVIPSFFATLVLWVMLELIVRRVAARGLKTDFYGSISRSQVRMLQEIHGLKLVRGAGWCHLGWIADPERETYEIQTCEAGGQWRVVDRTKTGSWLARGALHSGQIRVVAVPTTAGRKRILGLVSAESLVGRGQPGPIQTPVIGGPWQPLFKPHRAGDYINDHCIYQDQEGRWRVVGITGPGEGDYAREKKFAVGVGDAFPPETPFQESDPVAESDDPAWAPDVVWDGSHYHLFWSPHQLHHMVSEDGITWQQHRILMDTPHHLFFRDAMIFRVASDQWLLYATARGGWFSRVDIYQSFDLLHWQYIRSALRGTWGSEKNFVTGSMESPFLIQRDGRYYLSITYNNESFFLAPLLLQMKHFLKKRDYNNTLIFHSETPYNFGLYRGRKKTRNLVTRLDAHAPVYVQVGDRWIITTGGWPFAATLTDGEVAWAPLTWHD